MEWPRESVHWKQDIIETILRRYESVNADFGYCMYGLKIKYDDDVSMPIRHPMRFATMSSDVYKQLYKYDV